MYPDTTQQLWRTEFGRQYTREMLRDLVKSATALAKTRLGEHDPDRTFVPEDR